MYPPPSYTNPHDLTSAGVHGRVRHQVTSSQAAAINENVSLGGGVLKRCEAPHHQTSPAGPHLLQQRGQELGGLGGEGGEADS